MKKLSIITLLFLALQNNSKSQEISKKTETVEIKTSAICGMCKEKIEKEISFTKGIKKATLNKDTKILTVYYNPKKTNPQNIRLEISKIGYDADDIKADEKAYNKLSDCCKKDVEPHD